LFQAPTVRQMAAVVRGDQGRHTLPGAPLAPVTLRPGDADLPPLFYFPGAGGYSFEFRVIATELPPGRTVYGFNLPVAGEPGWRPRYDVKDLAADMLKAIRVLQPHGPYLLCGYSFGGFLAVEVARLLREQGEEPAMLLILDTWAPGFPKKVAGLRNVMLHTRNMISGGGFEYVAGRLHNIRKKVVRKVRWTARRWLGSTTPAAAPVAPVQERIAGALDTALQAEAEYDPEPYLGGMTLFRATIVPDWPACSFEDPTNGWSAHVRGQIDIHRFPCEHLGMFMSDAKGQIAAQLHQCMQAAEEGTHLHEPEPVTA
jgi:thioesterase domain-containing protein